MLPTGQAGWGHGGFLPATLACGDLDKNAQPTKALPLYITQNDHRRLPSCCCSHHVVVLKLDSLER